MCCAQIMDDENDHPSFQNIKNNVGEWNFLTAVNLDLFKYLIEYADYKKSMSEYNKGNDRKTKITSYFTGSDGHLSFSVAGTKFRTKNEIERLKNLKYVEELRLIPEPDNQYDSNAIAVYTLDNSLIGYVPKEMTNLMRDNTGVLKRYRCIFTKKTEHNPPFVYVRVEFPE